MIAASEAAKLVPGLVVESVTGAAYCGEDGYFDRPRAVVDAFASAARARGARLDIARVRRIEPDGGGFRIELDEGAVRAERVIVAAGVDTPTLLPDIDLPIEPVARHLFFSGPLDRGALRPLVVSAEREFAAKQLADGTSAREPPGRDREPCAVERSLASPRRATSSATSCRACAGPRSRRS